MKSIREEAEEYVRNLLKARHPEGDYFIKWASTPVTDIINAFCAGSLLRKDRTKDEDDR